MIKRVLSPTFILIIFLFSACTNAQESKDNSDATTNVIEVYDFHSTHRCTTCNLIETNTKYTLRTYFSEEMKSGRVVLKVVNVDSKKNYSTAEKFEATGTALFLNVIIDGNEKQIDLTEFAFMKGSDREEFSEELKLKIEKELALM